MPTYEYRCKDCGQHLEVVQSFRDDPLTECPGCSGTLKKVFRPIGIAFKGSGFYKTDSRSSGSSASKGSSGSSTDSSGSSSSTETSSSSAGSGDSSSGSGGSTSSSSDSSGSSGSGGEAKSA